MTLDGSLDVIAGGDRVTFRFRVRNDGDEPAELAFSDNGHADFAVETDGEERWRWSDGRTFAQVIETETIGPGDSVRYDGEWDAPEPGTYTAIATLRARSRALEVRTAFTVPEVE